MSRPKLKLKLSKVNDEKIKVDETGRSTSKRSKSTKRNKKSGSKRSEKEEKEEDLPPLSRFHYDSLSIVSAITD